MGTYQKPQTIAELLAFCNEKGMPLRTMRFFIGEDYPEPKAFGIFQDADGDFVVYKNKADGTRAIRYKGPDEAFAVNEIYEKLKSEVELRRNMRGDSGYSVSRSGGNGSGASAASTSLKTKIFAGVVIALSIFGIGACVYKEMHTPKRGYYRHNDTYYYYDTDDWYYYDDLAWVLIDDDDLGFYEDDYRDYFLSDDIESDYPVGDFRNSDYYDGYYEREDDYDWGDNDGGNDWGDWDAGATDWGTDW